MIRANKLNTKNIKTKIRVDYTCCTMFPHFFCLEAPIYSKKLLRTPKSFF